MKKRFLTLVLMAALAACNRTPANNMAGNESAGLPTPSERPATPAAPTQGAQQTAMPPGLDCVRNRMSPEERRGVAAVAMEQGSRDDPRMRPLMQAAEDCGDELSWSPQKRQLAALFSMSAAGAAGIREMLGSRGISFDELDQAILSDQELMAAAADPQQLTAAAQEFVVRRADLLTRMAGERGLDEEVGTRLGNYIAFRALAEGFVGSFARTS